MSKKTCKTLEYFSSWMTEEEEGNLKNNEKNYRMQGHARLPVPKQKDIVHQVSPLPYPM